MKFRHPLNLVTRSALAACLAALLWSCLGQSGVVAFAAGDGDHKARQVLQAAIEAMGGDKYLGVRNSTSSGRYFAFRKGRKSFTRFQDWTVYQPPVRSRFQLGKGKRSTVWIYNLGLDKGWKLEGEDSLESLTEEEIKDFKRVVRKDMDYILRQRLDEEGLSLFYYGPDDISGAGDTEAVEVLDLNNDAVVLFFNRETHLPVKVETHFQDKFGFRHKEEVEFYNWHWIDGVYAPLRIDVFVDEEVSRQRFLEDLAFNAPVPEAYFLEPVIKEKQ